MGDPASDPTAVEMSPVKAAQKDEPLASGALQDSSELLSDDASSGGVAIPSSHTLGRQSFEDAEPRKPINKRHDRVERETLPRRPEGAYAKPLSASRLASDQAERWTTLERHDPAHRQITSSSTSITEASAVI